MIDEKYVLAIDQGTTSTRAILFDHELNIVKMAQKEITNSFPFDGWVEQDAEEIWFSVLSCISDVLINSKIEARQIKSIGITNQRETTVVWSKKTGLPIYKALVWQSRQSKGICDELKKEGLDEWFKNKTGLVIDPYFSATKLKWILDNVEGSRKKAENGELLFGTIDCYLLNKLTNGKVHATDYSNASRTLMYNIYDLKWDDEILEKLNIPKKMLPVVQDSSGYFGETAEFQFFGDVKIPITAMIGDQQASLFGHGCFEAGMAKTTYGTGCFMLMNTKDKAVRSQKGLLTTLAWGINGKVDYAVEGSVFVAGSAITWLRDNVKLIKDPKKSEEYAKSVNDTANVYFVPAFVGLGAPYWDDKARGAFFGLTGGTTKKHLTRAVLEAIAFQNKDVLDVMHDEAKLDLKVLKVDGGVTNNRFLMQFQADILNVLVKETKVKETTALGAALLAGLASKYWSDKNEVLVKLVSKESYLPRMDEKKRADLYSGWKKAVQACQYYGKL